MPDDISSKYNTFMEMWNTQQSELADEVVAADVVYHVPPFQTGGLTELKKLVEDCRPIKNFHVVAEGDDLIDGDRSAHRWNVTGTWTDSTPVFPGEPTGKTARAESVFIFQWRNGKVVDLWHIGDWLGWWQTAGADIPAGS
jgi:hypothetical protein